MPLIPTFTRKFFEPETLQLRHAGEANPATASGSNQAETPPASPPSRRRSSLLLDRQSPSDMPILFSDSKYTQLSIDQFIASPDFGRCQAQYMRLLDGMAAFVAAHADRITPPLSPERVAAIKEDFKLLKEHLANGGGSYFSAQRSLVYGAGKEMFHKLEALLNDHRIPLQRRMNALIAMAPQLRVCAGGVFTVVKEALSSLEYSGTGIQGAAYRVKRQMVDALVMEHVRTTHGGQYLRGDEVHYANAYFNYLAHELGLPERQDLHARNLPGITPERLNRCRQVVLFKLKPDALSKVLADDYLSQIKGAQTVSATGRLQGEQIEEAFDLTRTLQEGLLDQEFGKVPLNSVLVTHEDGLSVRFAQQPTLVAKDLLEGLRETNLVNYDDTVWLTVGDKITGSIKMLGELFWRDYEGSCEELQAKDLLEVSPQALICRRGEHEVPAKERAAVLRGLLKLVLEAVEAGEIEHVPEAWLQECADLLESKEVGGDNHWAVRASLLAARYNYVHVLQALHEGGADMNDADGRGVTAAMQAAEQGHVAALQLLTDVKANLNTDDWLGMTPAMLAARNGKVETLQILVANGANLNASDRAKNTAAMLAAKHGHAEALRVLVEAKVNLAAKTTNGMTAAMLAVQHGQLGALQVLRDARVDVNHAEARGVTLAMVAAQYGQVGALEFLKRNGANLSAQDQDGVTPAMLAAKHNRVDVLKFLVTAKADLGAKDQTGKTAAMFAAMHGCTDALKLLVDAKVDLKAVDTDWMNATMLAAKNGHAQALEVLVEASGNLNKLNRQGLSAVMFAAQHGHLQAVKVLTKAGASIEKLVLASEVPAVLAARNGHAEVLRFLVHAGASLRNGEDETAAMAAAKNGHAQALQVLVDARSMPWSRVQLEAITPIEKFNAVMYAAQNGHADALKVLIKAGVSLNAADSRGMTALMLAAQNDSLDVVTTLVAARARLNAVNDEGMTALMLAAQKGHLDIVTVLIDAKAELNAGRWKGRTPAMVAAKYGHVEVLRALAAAGADLNATTLFGVTAAKLAAKHGRREALQFLSGALNAQS